jgi:hypothetical protein
VFYSVMTSMPYAQAHTLTPGARLYLSARTRGALDTTPSPGDPIGVARVLPDGGSIRRNPHRKLTAILAQRH